MSSYSNSEITRKKLIEAAGELFAEYGVKSVTTRQIAAKSGENIGIIHYHFGGKDGLVEATLDYASEEWKDRSVVSFVESNRSLINNHLWHPEFIERLVCFLYDLLLSDKKPQWCSTLLFQIIQRESDISDKFFNIVGAPSIDALSDVYRRLTGDSDSENAYCWSMTILSPAVLMAVDSASVKRVTKKTPVPKSLIQKLKTISTVNAVAGLAVHKTMRANHE